MIPLYNYKTLPLPQKSGIQEQSKSYWKSQVCWYSVFCPSEFATKIHTRLSRRHSLCNYFLPAQIACQDRPGIYLNIISFFPLMQECSSKICSNNLSVKNSSVQTMSAMHVAYCIIEVLWINILIMLWLYPD